MYNELTKMCCKRSLPYLKTTAFPVIIFFCAALFLASCFDFNKKEYRYIEKATSIVNVQTIISVEHKPLLIKAKSDSAAYIQAYMNFCFAEMDYMENFKKSGTKAGKPLSFQLLNEESVDISRSVNFMNKKLIEKRIKQKIATLEF